MMNKHYRYSIPELGFGVPTPKNTNKLKRFLRRRKIPAKWINTLDVGLNYIIINGVDCVIRKEEVKCA